MKANVTPELSSSWWKKNKPLTLKKTGLGAALKKYEKSVGEFEKFVKKSSAAFESHHAFMQCKTDLAEVEKCVDAGIKAANQTLHKETIAALKKYKSSVIPDEKNRLDKMFNVVKSASEAEVKKVFDAYAKGIQLYQAVAIDSAKMVLASRKESANVQECLSLAAEGQHKGKPEQSDKAAKRADLLASKMEAMAKDIELKNIKAKKARPQMKTDSMDQAEQKKYFKLADQITTYEIQTENNIKELKKLAQEAREASVECVRAAKGTADVTDMYLKTMDNLVNRAFGYAQNEIDVASRECSGATGIVRNSLENYGTSKDPKVKAEEKQRADQRLRHAISHLDALKKALKKARADVSKTLDGMPRDIVNPKNEKFVKLFKELERAISVFDAEEKTVAKESKKIADFTPKVKGMV